MKLQSRSERSLSDRQMDGCGQSGAFIQASGELPHPKATFTRGATAVLIPGADTTTSDNVKLASVTS